MPPLAEAAERLGVNVTWQPLPLDRLGDCGKDGSHINVGTHDPQVFFHELAQQAKTRLEDIERIQ